MEERLRKLAGSGVRDLRTYIDGHELDDRVTASCLSSMSWPTSCSGDRRIAPSQR
jgi:hypothetical protein